MGSLFSRLRLAAIAVSCTLLAPSLVRSNQASQALRDQGYDAVYNLDYDRAAELFKQAIAADTSDASSYRGAAKNAWLRILFVNGTVTSDQYMGKMSSSDLKVPTPPEPWASEFHRNIDRAIELGEKAVARSPSSASAHYELGAGLGYLASYTGTIDGKIFAAMRAARRAFSEHEKVLELDPKRHDAGLVVGTYRYLVSTLPMPLRWMAYMVGFGGGRETAIRRLQEAAVYPGDAQTEARFALILIYSREGRHDEALTVIRGLERSYPRNRLLWLEEGGAALRGKRLDEAERALNAGIAKMNEDSRPRMGGEAAMLFYKRGATRLLMKQTTAAEQDLRQALADGTVAPWVRGRIHTELGKAADLAGDRARARSSYQMAINLGEKSNDQAGVDVAKRLLEAPYRQ